MIQRFILLSLFCCSAMILPAQKNLIDKIDTQEDMVKFVTKRFKKSFSKSDFKKGKVMDETGLFKDANFIKLDLDNNGLTDLLVNDSSLFAITADGMRQYSLHRVSDDGFLRSNVILKMVDTGYTPPLLIISHLDHDPRSKQHGSTLVDTMTLVNGDWMYYQPIPSNFKIQKLKITATRCFGSCPEYTMIINRNGTAFYDAKSGNKLEGNFYAQLDTSQVLEVYDMLNYLKFESLEDEYAVDATDLPSYRLMIYYNDDEFKEIIDYGQLGTAALWRFYRRLDKLRKETIWH